MKYILLVTGTACAIGLGGVGLNASAQEENLQQAQYSSEATTDERPWELTLGLGMGVMPEFKGSEDSDFRVLPVVMGSYQLDEKNKLFLGVIGGLGWEHQLNERFSAGLKIGYVGDRESDDSNRLTGMPDIDSSVDGGPFISYQINEFFSAELATAFDLGNVHNGWTITPQLNYQNRLGMKWLAGGSIGLTYGDDNYTQTYFGVDPQFANANRAAYTAEAGISEASLGLNLTRLLDQNWFIRGDVIGTNYLGDADDSPILEEETTVMSFITVGYRF